MALDINIPLWVFFGLGASVFSALVLLIQDRFKADGFSLAFWNKAGCALIMLPFVIWQGFPDQPLFYMLLCLQALLWVVSDVIFFKSIPVVGAGVISRLQPLAVIVTFILWFFIDPALLDQYLQTPVRFALVFIVLCLAAFFASQLKQCEMSWRAIKLIWFVLVASVIGPIMAKLVMAHAPLHQAPFAWVFCEALFMTMIWGIYYILRRPVAGSVFLSALSVKTGFYVAGVSSFMVVMNVTAFHLVDNPAYIPAVKFLDALIILMVYKFQGRRETANVTAGLGIVGSACALVLLRSWQ